MSLTPPPASAQPATSVGQAYRAFLEYDGRLSHDRQAVPEIYLVEFTDTVSGEINAAGQVDPSFVHVLAWAIINRDVAVRKAGPALPSSGSDSGGGPEFADTVSVIDATTGAYLEGFDGMLIEG